jgi:hypothetical protein
LSATGSSLKRSDFQQTKQTDIPNACFLQTALASGRTSTRPHGKHYLGVARQLRVDESATGANKGDGQPFSLNRWRSSNGRV